MKRTPLPRRTPLRSKPIDRPATKGPRPAAVRRAAIRRKKSRSAETAAFWCAQREALFARAGDRCEVGGCNLVDTGMEAHHRKLRSRGVDHSLPNLLAVCLTHHEQIHRHPAAATDAGWMVPSWSVPVLVPVQLPDGGAVFLTAAGGYTTEPEQGA